MKNPLTLLLAMALSSCGPPKAIIVAEAPVKPAVKTVAAAPAPVQKPSPPANADDGLRLPDMLALPDEEQLRSSPDPSGGGSATVITSPPAD